MNSRDIAILVGVGTACVLLIAYAGKKQVLAAAAGAGSILSGNNSLTAGTAYSGMGIFGTLGAGTNSLLGGAPSAVGEWIGGTFADWMGY